MLKIQLLKRDFVLFSQLSDKIITNNRFIFLVKILIQKRENILSDVKIYKEFEFYRENVEFFFIFGQILMFNS